MANMEQYRRADGPLPGTYLAWQIFGAGFDNIGKDGKPTSLELRPPAENEILCRVDALGLCLSDIKIVNQGSKHPRLRGRDLSVEPTVLGHECSATVVKVGAQWQDTFHVGERYIVQADIYYKGLGFAFGYLIPGGLAQYFYLDERALDGDEGCYLLPVQPDTGYSQAALSEPWACVEMSYNLDERLVPGGGELLIVDDDPARWHEANPSALIVPRSLDELTDEKFDDIIVPNPSPEIVEALAPRLRKGGVMFLLGEPASQGAASLDIGRIHYDDIRFLGGGPDVDAVRVCNERGDLLPEGSALFIGAGGPMGQMHVQRAIELDAGSKCVVVTDLDRSRLDHIEHRFGELARAKGVALHTFSPSQFESQTAMDGAVHALAPQGYDDVCVLAPVPALVSAAMSFAADNALVNVFAGIPIGNPANLQLADLCRGIKIIGSSGSRISDLRRILQLVESKQLNTDMSVAAVGGLAVAREGLEGVKSGRFPGKTVIYTQILDLPLMGLDEIAAAVPEVAAKLGPNNAWTKEAEQALLERYA
ncbi:MAG: alcohol dehydrogenase catalytic domain-containing protein [Candidatus Hydrogenedentes bacterium]|nr:alcohol dehydrogenase catalytic domain-containing protein [Candidatus Hydrogenedentota bacterium]